MLPDRRDHISLTAVNDNALEKTRDIVHSQFLSDVGIREEGVREGREGVGDGSEVVRICREVLGDC